jgi:ferredoxin
MEKPKANVNKQTCLACGGCISLCPQDAIILQASKAHVKRKKCISCTICIKACPVGAITWEDA